ncbi:MAG: methylmalonyl Co-A mutase-associated GTPase MeaB [Proteobacteria bacterium]|nr:methylmalonyl Co-A mutase-associated GTPase MeaB [Pseudomonadota bacterium]MDA1356653.1 methylmalonyl Co-A mutase-associated GTPase MeaB [Pseudomonadota bacterium]
MPNAEDIRSGNRRALARAITLIESAREDHRSAAQELLETLLPYTGQAVRIGVSGSPGVGKSTFIEAFGLYLIGIGKRLAVLAVDPSSALSGGSILGDKTRMERLAREPDVFIRPSPAAGVMGGVARRTREAMLACEAAGFDVVLIETVGVGQSEAAVADLVDLFALLVQPGGGDDLQGIKRGVMELADLVIVTKADGDLRDLARHAEADYRSALGLIRGRGKGPRPHVLSCSAVEERGMDEVWQAIESQRSALDETGELARKRAAQATSWMWREVEGLVMSALLGNAGLANLSERLQTDVAEGRKTPAAAAAGILAAFRKTPRNKSG